MHDLIQNFCLQQKKNYEFSYKVVDNFNGDDFSHTQSQDSGATNGEYRVKLPDGRVQIVSYTADKNGYKADVKYTEKVEVQPKLYLHSSLQPQNEKNYLNQDQYTYYQLNNQEGGYSQLSNPGYGYKDSREYTPIEETEYEQEYITATARPIYKQSLQPNPELILPSKYHQDVPVRDLGHYSQNVVSTAAPEVEYTPVYVNPTKYSIVQRYHHPDQIVHGK